MPLSESVKNDLSKLEHTPFHKALLDLVLDQHSRSASVMAQYYDTWDKHADTVAGYRCMDKEDRRSAQKKEPTKMVVPTAKAQLHTFVAFLFLYYQQRQHAFEYAPKDANDHLIREVIETLVDDDCRQSNWPTTLYQFILDCGRFNLGVLEETWERETRPFPQTVFSDDTILGISFASETTEMVDVPVFEGNRIKNISPYHFFPDPSVPLTKIHEGEFCGVEDEMSRTRLKQMEHEGTVAGIDYIKDYNTKSWQETGRGQKRNRFVGDPNSPDTSVERKKGNSQGMVSVLRHMVKLIPKDFLIDGEPMGEEDYPVIWIVWVANDDRVIRAEPANYLHGKFNFNVGQFDPDIHFHISEGLPGVIDKLQEAISWFINSHVLSVKRNLDHSLIFDDRYIDAEALQRRSPIIPLKKSVGSADIRSKVFQLQMTDVTGKHLQDAQSLLELTSLITGINESALGGVHGGRRSATEHRAANQGASARLRTIGITIYDMGLSPLANKLKTNLRQALSREAYDQRIGLPDPNNIEAVMEHERNWELFKADPAHLATSADYFPLDAVDPNQRIYMTQALSELFKVIMSVPDAAAAFDIDPQSVFKELMRLQGTGPVERHSLRARMAKQQQQVTNGNPNQPGQPTGIIPGATQTPS